MLKGKAEESTVANRNYKTKGLGLIQCAINNQ